MVYDFNKMNKWSQGNAFGCNQLWNYTDTGTAIATIVAANFFDPVNINPANPAMNIGDLIWIIASDVLDGEFAQVTAISPHITVSVFNAVLGAGSVGTNNLADGAVTNQKLGAAAVDTTILDPTTIQYLRVNMTAAEWNGMYAAPKLLVAAPGAGKRINLLNSVFKMTFVAAQYAAGGAAAIQYDSTVHGGGTAATPTVAAATVNGFAASSNFSLAGDVASSAITTTENKGLYMSNDTGAFTTGDGTWHIDLWYNIVTA